MSEQFIETEIETTNENVEIPKKKKELSLKQLEHLNNIRVKALEKKREIKLKKNKEYENKVVKPEVIEEPIKPLAVQSEPIKHPEPIKSDVKKKKGKKPEVIPQPVQQIEKSYNDLLCESSLERMQSKIMNERAKHLITHIIPNYY